MTEAPLDGLPRVLAAAPWIPTRKKKKLALPALPRRAPRLVWKTPAEEREWADPWSSSAARTSRHPLDDLSPHEREQKVLQLFLARGIVPIDGARHLSKDSLKQLLGVAEHRVLEHHLVAHVALGRFGLEMLDTLLALFTRDVPIAFDCFRRIDDRRIAEQLFATQDVALVGEWYVSFPETAAAVLVPIALTGGPKDAARALKTLAYLRSHGKEQAERAIDEVSSLLGDDARDELAFLLAPPPLPSKPPVLPRFIDVTSLPSPALLGGAVLPPIALQRLLELLALFPLEAAKSAVATVLPACDRTSLAELARALFERWIADDVDPKEAQKEKWVLHAAAFIGDDLVAHQLAERTAIWADSGLHKRAALGVEALAAIASDVALMHLARFADKSKAKALKKRAAAELDRYREAEGLSVDALADRLVPDLGFDARGELVLDYGPRQLRVVFDETLKASLRDGDTPVKSIPRAQATDDAAKVARAQATWAALKTETKTLMEAQARRLERAMCARRRWSSGDFAKYFHRHPLMQHLTRRLVWGTFDARGTMTATFRLAEDGTFADANDSTFELTDAHVTIGIVHPLTLGQAACAAWGDLFGNYQIVQPFPQLARELYTLTPAESIGAKVTRFEGTPIAGGRFFSLKHRGWDFSDDYDIGKRLPDGSSVHLASEPGLGFLMEKPEDQTLGVLTLEHFYRASDDGTRAETFGALDPIDVSEVLRDVELLKR